MKIFLMSLAAALLMVGVATAGDCCNKAGCCKKCGAQMTCKIVCEMKKVEKIVWAVECEPICAANPGCCKHGCGGCDKTCAAGDCGSCGKCGPCAELLSRPQVKPHCTPPRCRKKLVKKTIVCEVPSYKCVPVACCSCCGCNECGCDSGGCDSGECDSGECDQPKEESMEKSVMRFAPLPPLTKFSLAQ